MPKRYLLLLLCTYSVQLSLACDVCGGGSTFMNNIFPNYSENFIGLGFDYQRFHNTVRGSLDGIERYKSAYHFYQTQLQGQYLPHKKWRVQVLLPLRWNLLKRTEGANISQQNALGIGDAVVQCQYNIYNSTFAGVAGKQKHNLLLGMGIKLPTGKHNHKASDGRLLSRELQTGTGTWDVFATLSYQYKYDKLGINQSVQYQVNGQDAQRYRFGNRFQWTSLFFYLIEKEESVLLPTVAWILEYKDLDRIQGLTQLSASGFSLQSQVGLRFFYKKIQCIVQSRVGLWQSNSTVSMIPQWGGSLQVFYTI